VQYKKLGSAWILVLQTGDRLIEQLTVFIKQKHIRSGYFNAIGALSKAEIAHYDLRRQKYHYKTFNEALEIISLTGNISRKGKKIVVHAHIALGTTKMLVYGGHLKEATVSVTCELIIKKENTLLKRTFDQRTGLNLLNLK
jgi:uncharacterized protein